ncbi:hypothetical protein [Trichlorobacter sp.]|uniref:hypothetical protein n=1 Tax=Trichlorobacter sp. TaxID=2911007 RepID=UPI002A367FC9|nr:hypothetical protein [Trichlorobacter sp.]MDY0385282.1 hypothetical protein [Trichlorobacter sp.]
MLIYNRLFFVLLFLSATITSVGAAEKPSPTSSAITPAQKYTRTSQEKQKITSPLPAFLLKMHSDLATQDYHTIAAQMFHHAVQDYERWLKQGQPEDFHNALFHINSSIEITPDASEYLFFQGMLYASLKASPASLTQATDSFLSVLELQPDHRQARFALAQVLQEQGKFRLAAEQYQLLLEAYPEMVTGLVLAPLGFCYLAGDYLEFGLDYLKNLSHKHPKSAPLRTTLAILLQNNNRNSEADKELKQIQHEKLGTKSEQEYARLLQTRWQMGGKP